MILISHVIHPIQYSCWVPKAGFFLNCTGHTGFDANLRGLCAYASHWRVGHLQAVRRNTAAVKQRMSAPLRRHLELV